MKTRFAAALIVAGLSLTILAPQSASAAGAGAATRSIAVENGAPLAQRAYYRGYRGYRRHWGYYGYGPRYYYGGYYRPRYYYRGYYRPYYYGHYRRYHRW